MSRRPLPEETPALPLLALPAHSQRRNASIATTGPGDADMTDAEPAAPTGPSAAAAAPKPKAVPTPTKRYNDYVTKTALALRVHVIVGTWPIQARADGWQEIARGRVKYFVEDANVQIESFFALTAYQMRKLVAAQAGFPPPPFPVDVSKEERDAAKKLPRWKDELSLLDGVVKALTAKTFIDSLATIEVDVFEIKRKRAIKKERSEAFELARVRKDREMMQVLTNESEAEAAREEAERDAARAQKEAENKQKAEEQAAAKAERAKIALAKQEEQAQKRREREERARLTAVARDARLTEKERMESERDSNKRVPVQRTWPDMTDKQWQMYKAEKDALSQTEKEFMASGKSKSQYALKLGNRIKAEEEERKQLSANDAFTNWPSKREERGVKVGVLKRELRLVTIQLTKAGVEGAPEELARLAKALGARVNEIKSLLALLGVNVNAKSPLDAFFESFPGCSKEDFVEFDNQREALDEKRREFLQSGDRSQNEWRIEFGYADKADEEIRKNVHTETGFPGNTFPLATWTAYKAANPSVGRRIEAKLYDMLTNLVKSLEYGIVRKQREADALSIELYELQTRAQTQSDQDGMINAELQSSMDAKQAEVDDAYSAVNATKSKNKRLIEDVVSPRLDELQDSKDSVKDEEDRAKREVEDKKREERQQKKEKASEEAAAAKAKAKVAKAAVTEANRLAKKAEEAANKPERDRLVKEAKEAKEEAKRAKLAEKKARRKAAVAKAVIDRLGEAAYKETELAVVIAVLDLETERLQQELDEKQKPTLDCDEESLPKQPTEERRRTEGATGSSGVWPITQVPFTIEQHALLFLTETEAFADPDDDARLEAPSDAADAEMAPLEPDTAPGGDAMSTDANAGATKKKKTKLTKEQQALQADLLSKLEDDALISSELLLFNKPYARCLLTAHLRSVRQQYLEMLPVNPKIEFVDVAGCLGPITVDGTPTGAIDEDKLESTVEQLLPSFEHMLRYRNTALKVKEIEIVGALELVGETQLSKVKMREELQAIRALSVGRADWEFHAKRMLQADHGQLPGQLFAPQPSHLPLRISAPPRVGKSATALLVASLAKRVGMLTMYSVSPNKLMPIAEMSKKLTRLGWRSVANARAADNALRGTANENLIGVEMQCTRMKFNWTTVSDLVGDDACSPDPSTDFMLYSSDVVGDVMRAGALLSSWRRSRTVVFHMRDEAQSLSKEEMNDVVSCHSEFVPPPPTLQYLRAYFGNLFGLNCLVTATMFPTMLEEALWGFFGSTGQNVRAGLPISANLNEVRATLGANYLPSVVQSLRPYVSPGYVGVDRIVEWRYQKDESAVVGKDGQVLAGSKTRGDVATLQYGANHQGVRYDGTTRTPVETASDLLEAKKQKQKRDKRGGGNAKTRTKDKKKDEEYEKTLERVRQQAQNTMEDTLQGRVTADNDNSKRDADYQPTNNSNMSEAQIKQLKKRLINEDARAIKAHFEDWLENAQEGEVDEFRARDDEPASNFTGTNTRLVPMYIGALNRNIADSALVSFVRHFGALAHNRTKQRRASGKDSSKQACGVAFCLFASIFNSRADIEKDGGGIRFVHDEEIEKVYGVPEGSKFRPCDGVSEAPEMSLVTFVYNPEDDANSAKNNDSQKTDASPAFEVFLAPNAEAAIEEVYLTHTIGHVAILGYGMLQAGLTVQSVVTAPLFAKAPERTRGKARAAIPMQIGTYKRVYCPSYVALATAEDANLDTQLQIAGRAFVELKGVVAPRNWTIKLLGVKDMADRLVRYSAMETILANIKNMRLFEALKTSFTSQIMTENEYGTLGTVGVRSGDFSSILGLTAEVAARRAAAAKRGRERAKAAGMVGLDEVDNLAQQELAAAESEAAAAAVEDEDDDSASTPTSEEDEVEKIVTEAGGPKRLRDGETSTDGEDEGGVQKRSRAELKAALLAAPALERVLLGATGRRLRLIERVVREW